MKLEQLNRLRVDSKHHALVPSRKETERLIVSIRGFFDDVCRSLLGLAFATISLIELIDDEQTKNLLLEAENAFHKGNYPDCLIACRRALFLEVESRFDASAFLSSNETIRAFMDSVGGKRVPHHARDKAYLDETLRDATDFIVINQAELEVILIQPGVDSTSFSNVQRLTPAVYHTGNRWVVKRELDKVTGDDLRQRTEYVLGTTISMFVAASQKSATYQQA